MSIDPYSVCPGACGKKLKFCSADLIHDFEKIRRMLEGDQQKACLEHIKKLRQKHPDRCSLLGLQAMLESELEQQEQLEETLKHYLAVYPNNPVALAETAILRAREQKGDEAVDALQDALSQIEDDIPQRVYAAIGTVSQSLLMEGKIIAARAHLLLQAGIGGTDDPRAASLLMRLNAAQEIPVVLKDDPQLALPADDAPSINEFNDAVQDALRGCWKLAGEKFQALIQSAGDLPEAWRNLGLVRAWLADNEGAAAALRKYTTLDIPLDDAVETEAYVQLIDPASRTDKLEVVKVLYPTDDSEQVETALISSRQATKVDFNPESKHSSEDVPPRSLFWILDREMPATGVEIALADVPNVLCQAFVYGKQTDRSARLELVAPRNDDLTRGQQVLSQICPQGLSLPTEEPEVLSEISASQDALGWTWRLPDDTPLEHRQKLLAEKRRETIFKIWPELKLPVLDGKSARQVAQDPAMQVRLLAAILLLELASESDDTTLDFNELRKELGLPAAETVDPTDLEDFQLSLMRMARLDAQKLSDEQLAAHYRRAVVSMASSAIANLATEVIARPSLDGKVDKAEAHGILADLEPSSEKAITHIEMARTITEDAGESSAPWDLAELALHIESGNVSESQRLLQHIQTAHINEPGVGQRLMQILMSAGVIDSNGMPAGPPPEEAAGLFVPGQESAASPSIVTSAGEPAAAGSEKSKIWTPGMD